MRGRAAQDHRADERREVTSGVKGCGLASPAKVSTAQAVKAGKARARAAF